MCMDNGSGVRLGVWTAEELWRPHNKASDSHHKRLWKLIYCGKTIYLQGLEVVVVVVVFVLNASIYIKAKRHLEVIPMGRWIFTLYDLIRFGLNDWEEHLQKGNMTWHLRGAVKGNTRQWGTRGGRGSSGSTAQPHIQQQHQVTSPSIPERLLPCL